MVTLFYAILPVTVSTESKCDPIFNNFRARVDCEMVSGAPARVRPEVLVIKGFLEGDEC